jgi:hypothetical protein
MKQLNAFFEVTVEVPRIRIGGRQAIETLINEEALLFAKYLRNEKKDWMPRIGTTNQNRTWELQLDRARKGDSVSLRN